MSLEIKEPVWGVVGWGAALWGKVCRKGGLVCSNKWKIDRERRGLKSVLDSTIRRALVTKAFLQSGEGGGERRAGG